MIRSNDFLLHVKYGVLFQVKSVDLEKKTFRAITNGSDVSDTIFYFSEINPSQFVPVSVLVKDPIPFSMKALDNLRTEVHSANDEYSIALARTFVEELDLDNFNLEDLAKPQHNHVMRAHKKLEEMELKLCEFVLQKHAFKLQGPDEN